MSKLIIIRGNSGSGKTIIAKRLQQDLQPRFAQDLDHGTMLVSQDVIRRDILRTKDGPDNPSIQLIKDTVTYGLSIGFDVIIEGILVRNVYGAMLHELSALFVETHIYYFDISFEETLRRHQTKPNAHEFGEKEMRRWYVANDVLNLPGEKLFTNDQSQNDILSAILNDLQ
jgi:adenylate kinase family enzyme